MQPLDHAAVADQLIDLGERIRSTLPAGRDGGQAVVLALIEDIEKAAQLHRTLVYISRGASAIAGGA